MNEDVKKIFLDNCWCEMYYSLFFEVWERGREMGGKGVPSFIFLRSLSLQTDGFAFRVQSIVCEHFRTVVHNIVMILD